MKTTNDVLSQATAEITHARTRYPGKAVTLWYFPTRPGRDGGILAARHRPSPGYLRLGDIPATGSPHEVAAALMSSIDISKVFEVER